MPKLEQGDLDGVEALKNVNIPQLLKLARAGYAILTGVPSCTLMFKQELPLMFPNDADVLAVRDAMGSRSSIWWRASRTGLKTDFTKGLGKVSYHVPCHGRVQNIGRKTEEFPQEDPGQPDRDHRALLGHAGTFGVKKEFHAMAMKIGKPVFRMMAGTEPDIISSDCPLGGHHLSQGISGTAGQEPGTGAPSAWCGGPTGSDNTRRTGATCHNLPATTFGHSRNTPPARRLPRRSDRAQAPAHGPPG